MDMCVQVLEETGRYTGARINKISMTEQEWTEKWMEMTGTQERQADVIVGEQYGGMLFEAVPT